jgi:hypothetical protein
MYEEHDIMNRDVADTGLTRRHFLSKAGVGIAGFAATTAFLAACTPSDQDTTGTTASDGDDGDGDGDGTDTTVDLSQTDAPEISWDMATSWPLALPTLFGGAQSFANDVSRLTGGKFTITPRAAGEIVGGLEVLPAVRDGGVEAGHTASYYYIGVSPATQFGTGLPFGLTERQQNAWLYAGGGLEILQQYYAEEFGVIQFPAGNTGCQMGGWFTREINTVGDLQGLKMRIPGLAGRILAALGVEQVTVAGGEILTSIETGRSTPPNSSGRPMISSSASTNWGARSSITTRDGGSPARRSRSSSLSTHGTNCRRSTSSRSRSQPSRPTSG